MDDERTVARVSRPSADWKGIQERVTGARVLVKRFGDAGPARARSHELDRLDALRDYAEAQADVALVHARDVMEMTFEEIASVTSKSARYWSRRYEKAVRRLRPARGTRSPDLDGGLRDEWESLMKAEPHRLREQTRPATKSEKRSPGPGSNLEGIIDIRSRRPRPKG